VALDHRSDAGVETSGRLSPQLAGDEQQREDEEQNAIGHAPVYSEREAAGIPRVRRSGVYCRFRR
jgi:hypothetical protein